MSKIAGRASPLMKKTKKVTKKVYSSETKGGEEEIRSKDCVSIPWSRPPIVQVENLFGVEQIVEFPKDSMEKKREAEKENVIMRSHSRANTSESIDGGNAGQFKPHWGEDQIQVLQTMKSRLQLASLMP